MVKDDSQTFIVTRMHAHAPTHAQTHKHTHAHTLKKNVITGYLQAHVLGTHCHNLLSESCAVVVLCVQGFCFCGDDTHIQLNEGILLAVLTSSKKSVLRGWAETAIHSNEFGYILFSVLKDGVLKLHRVRQLVTPTNPSSPLC